MLQLTQAHLVEFLTKRGERFYKINPRVAELLDKVDAEHCSYIISSNLTGKSTTGDLRHIDASSLGAMLKNYKFPCRDDLSIAITAINLRSYIPVESVIAAASAFFSPSYLSPAAEAKLVEQLEMFRPDCERGRSLPIAIPRASA